VRTARWLPETPLFPSKQLPCGGINDAMSWMTDQVLLGVLGLLFLVEQFRLLRSRESLFYERWNGPWEECPVLLENSQIRMVWLPISPISRMAAGIQCRPLSHFTDSTKTMAEDLADPREIGEVLAFLKAWERHGRWLRGAATALAISLSLLLVLWVGRVDVGIPFPVRWGLGITVGFWWATVALYGRAAKSLDATSGSVRRRQMVELLISPLSALKAYSLLGKSGLTKKHPQAVTWAVVPLPTLHQWVRDFCQSPDGAEESPPSRVRHMADDLEWLNAMLLRRGTSLSEALASPRRDPGAVCYCPRCHGQFIRPTTTCPSCETTCCRPFDGESHRTWSATDIPQAICPMPLGGP
jgi:hypothetical protein